MSQNNFDPIISQDVLPGDDSAPSNIGNPISQAEIDDLLYGEELSAGERLARLRTLRDELQMQEADDVGEGDPQSLLMSVDEAIAALETAESADNVAILEVERDLADLEALSPDDDLRLMVEDAAEELTVDDEEAAVISDWDAENDGHDGRHGFH
jgi:hypothetical protein